MTTTVQVNTIQGWHSYNVDLAAMPAQAAQLGMSNKSHPMWYVNNDPNDNVTLQSGMWSNGGMVFKLDDDVTLPVPVVDQETYKAWLVVDHSKQNTFTGTIEDGNYEVVDNQTYLQFGGTKPTETQTISVSELWAREDHATNDQLLVEGGKNGIVGTSGDIKFLQSGAVLSSDDKGIKVDSDKFYFTEMETTMSIYTSTFYIRRMGNLVIGNLYLPNDATTATTQLIPFGFRPSHNAIKMIPTLVPTPSGFFSINSNGSWEISGTVKKGHYTAIWFTKD